MIASVEFRKSPTATRLPPGAGGAAARVAAGLALGALSALLATWAFTPCGYWPLIWVAWIPIVLAQPWILPGQLAGLAPGLGIGGFYAGWRIGIVTNGETKQQENKVRAAVLDQLVDPWVDSDAVGSRKPDPRIFKIAADRCDTDLKRGWMFGNHPEADIRGAANMGLRTIWLRRGRLWDLSDVRPIVQADSLLAGLAHLVGLAPADVVSVGES